MASEPPLVKLDISRIERPDSALLRYYVICSLAAGPAFLLPLIPLLCRYYTLRYRFDDRGISMSWGVLFRRETYLTYKRIQDIHLNRNIIQRWLNLATLSVQTASGSATPEMKIEGLLEAEPLRDYLYSQMRGSRQEQAPPTESTGGERDEVLQLLTSIRDNLQKVIRPALRDEAV